MKKRILSVLITVVMLIGMLPTAVFAVEATYDLWVGGVQVTSANKDNIVVPDANGSAKYDPTTNTLTLNNFSYTNAAGVDAIISDGMNLTIVLKGENAFSVGGMGICVENGTLTISDSDEDDTVGSLEMISGLDAFAPAIYSGGSISIDGVELLAACDGASSTRTDPTFAIFSETVSIKDSTVTVRVLNVQNGLAIMASTLTVKNSTVEANGTYGAILDSATFSHSGVSGLVPTLNGDHVVYAGNDNTASSVGDDAKDDAATYANKYVRIAPAEPETETKSTTITYQVDPTFTVTIPATVALGETATIKAENVVVAKGKQVEVALTNANGFTVATPQGAELGYTVKNGETTVNEGDIVLTVNPDNGKTGETTLTFTTPETVKFAGDYTGTVTFTIAVNTDENN